MSKETLLQKDRFNFADLCELIDVLRAPDGCPWDREQTHASIRKSLIEETYEVVEGIDSNDNAILCEELGDLLLQIVFHAAIAADENAFNMEDICTGVCKKLIYRHPHVFADTVAETPEQVLYNWDELKKKEKGQTTRADILNGVSRALPSLMRAQKLSKKAGEQVSLQEACDGIIAAATALKNGGGEDALGDVLFNAARIGNLQKTDLEQLLYAKNEQFCEKNKE